MLITKQFEAHKSTKEKLKSQSYLSPTTGGSALLTQLTVRVLPFFFPLIQTRVGVARKDTSQRQQESPTPYQLTCICWHSAATESRDG